MKSRALIIGTILSLVIAIMIPGVAEAKKPPQPEDPSAAGLLYGDLYVVERDGAGVPVTREVGPFVDPHTGETTTANCFQPLASDCALLPFWGECGETLPEGVLPLPDCEFDPDAHDACEVFSIEGDENYDYASEIQEVSFGRGSVTRARAFVIDSAYGEFLKVINDAEDLQLDPAGRFQMWIPSETDPVEMFWKTVDAPLENLGMFRAAMSYGCFNTVTEETTGEEGAAMVHTSALDPTAILLLFEHGLEHLICPYEPQLNLYDWDWDYAKGEEINCTVTDDPPESPDLPCWWELPVVPDRTAEGYEPGEGVDLVDMDAATAFLAAATDKGDPMSLDEAITINTYTGINIYTYTKYRQERVLTVKYFPFADVSDAQFTYDRSATFPTNTTADLLYFTEGGALTPWVFVEDPALPLFATPTEPEDDDYSFVDLDAVNLTVCRDGSPVDGLTCDNPDETVCGGANWFAQATEHRRRTVWYLHNWSVPELDN